MKNLEVFISLGWAPNDKTVIAQYGDKMTIIPLLLLSSFLVVNSHLKMT